jgi:hypothetical protein
MILPDKLNTVDVERPTPSCGQEMDDAIRECIIGFFQK